MEWDEARTKAEKPLHLSPDQIGALSIEELEARIADLEAEIAACRKAIDGKQSSKAAADAVFS